VASPASDCPLWVIGGHFGVTKADTIRRPSHGHSDTRALPPKIKHIVDSQIVLEFMHQRRADWSSDNDCQRAARQTSGTKMDQLIYTPSIFDQKSIAAAKQVVLTVPRDIADEFWDRATVATGNLIMEAMRPTQDDVLLDFGCGIGRLAKELIGRTGCRVVGVDISAAMRGHAVEYVASDRFSVMSSEEFAQLSANRTRTFSGAYAIIVLQHVLEPQIELRRIAATCNVEAPFFVYNCINRCVPSNKGWVNDGQDVGRLASEIFDFQRQFEVPQAMLLYPNQGPLPGEIEGHWFRLFRNKSIAA